MNELQQLLKLHPIVWLFATLLVFWLAAEIYRRSHGFSLLHPVLVSIVVLVGLLTLTHTSYQDYFDSNKIIHWLLGPATVALAVPLYDHFAHVRRLCIPLLTMCLVGGLVACGSVMLCAWLLGVDDWQVLFSLAPKSTTTPVAIGISEKLGGVAALTTGAVLLTGILGCLLEPVISRVFAVRDDCIRGIALGVAAHGIGTAHAFRYSVLSGVMASVAMTLTAALSSFLLPPLFVWLHVGAS